MLTLRKTSSAFFRFPSLAITVSLSPSLSITNFTGLVLPSACVPIRNTCFGRCATPILSSSAAMKFRSFSFGSPSPASLIPYMIRFAARFSLSCTWTISSFFLLRKATVSESETFPPTLSANVFLLLVIASSILAPIWVTSFMLSPSFFEMILSMLFSILSKRLLRRASFLYTPVFCG